MSNSVELHQMNIAKTQQLSARILRLWLEPQQPFSHQAGDYIMLGLDAQQRKPFSIANAPTEDGLIELHVRNQDDSEWMQQLFALPVGAQLWVEDAKPQYRLQAETELNLFIAGGTGIAPMQALLQARIQQGIQQPTYLYWGTHSIEECYINAELQALSAAHPQLHYISVISEPSADWNGPSGLVHEYALSQHSDVSNASVYLCGCWPMVQQAKQDFIQAGLPASRYQP